MLNCNWLHPTLVNANVFQSFIIENYGQLVHLITRIRTKRGRFFPQTQIHWTNDKLSILKIEVSTLVRIARDNFTFCFFTVWYEDGQIRGLQKNNEFDGMACHQFFTKRSIKISMNYFLPNTRKHFSNWRFNKDFLISGSLTLDSNK